MDCIIVIDFFYVQCFCNNYHPCNVSAGVGRTGTYIGLDSLLREGRGTGEMDVFEFVKHMREDRMTMVQTPVRKKKTDYNFKKKTLAK